MYADFVPFNFTIAMFVFIAASLTDAFDGHIARKYNLVTDFGKFLDPLADKALVIAALAVFVEYGTMGAVPFFIIIAREFMVSGLRLVTADKGVVVAAGFWGKLKTAFTMAAIILILLIYSVTGDFDFFGFEPPPNLVVGLNLLMTIAIWLSVALTVISGLVYLKGYWKYIDSDK